MKKIFPVSFLTIIVGFLMFYLTLPSLNFKSASLYVFIFSIVIVFACFYFLFSVFSKKGKIKIETKNTNLNLSKIYKIALIPVILIVFIIVIFIGSSPIFNASAYRNQILIPESDFVKEISEISNSQIPVVDKDTAIRLGNRKVGEVVELVSQFNVAEIYTQTNYQNKPVRVTPLYHVNFIKWFSNQKEGIPYLITVDMASQETELVKLKEGMKYTPSDFFNRNLNRHLRFLHPTFMYSEPSFELNDDGEPYFIVPVYDYEIGLLGGKDITKVVLLNASTGKDEVYNVDDVPTWVDNVYPSDIILTQSNNWGKYSNGFFNSLFSQKNVLQTTDGYNYLAINDDVWLYTGLTSVSSDKSNIGFILVNKRTKESKLFPVNGAEEFSAMASAEGQVQEKSYVATFPILLNIDSNPTYFLSLKDNAGLVKQYAFVSVENYQIVGTGSTTYEAMNKYTSLLNGSGLNSNSSSSENMFEASGTIKQISTFVEEGSSSYYIIFENDDNIYKDIITNSPIIPTLNVGDTISIKYSKKNININDEVNIYQIITIGGN